MKNFKSKYLLLATLAATVLMLLPTSSALARDSVRPVINNLNVTPEASNGTKTITVNFSLSEKSNVTAVLYKDGKNYKTAFNKVTKNKGTVTWTWVGTKPNGKYTINVNAKDMAGNAAVQKVKTFVIDNIKPTITSASANKNLVSNESVKITYTVSEDAKVIAKIYPFGTTIYTGTVKKGTNNFSWAATGPDGFYTIQLTAIDAAGNASIVKNIGLKRDGNAPMISGGTSIPVTKTNNGFVHIYINESSNITLKIYNSEKILVKTINAGTLTVGDHNIAWDGKDLLGQTVSDGVYSVIIEAVDAANNYAQYNASWLVETIIKITGIVDKGIYNKYVSASFIQGTATLSFNGGAPTPYASGSPIIADGDYTLVVTDGAEDTKTINFTIDKTLPVFTNVIASPTILNSTMTETNVSFTLSENADVTAMVYDNNRILVRTINVGSTEAGNKNVLWDGKDDLGNTVPNGDYNITIYAKDSAANNAIPTSKRITVEL